MLFTPMNNASKHRFFAILYLLIAGLLIRIFHKYIYQMDISIFSWEYNYKLFLGFAFALIGFSAYIFRKIPLMLSKQVSDEDPIPTYTFFYPILLLTATSLLFPIMILGYDHLGVATYILFMGLSLASGWLIDFVPTLILKLTGIQQLKSATLNSLLSTLNPRILIPSLSFTYFLLLQQFLQSQNIIIFTVNTTLWIMASVALAPIFRLTPILIEAVLRKAMPLLLWIDKKLGSRIINSIPTKPATADYEDILTNKFIVFNECVLYLPALFFLLSHFRIPLMCNVTGIFTIFTIGIGYLINYYFHRVKNMDFGGLRSNAIK